MANQNNVLRLFITASILLFVLTRPASAQVPANDECPNAIPIGVGSFTFPTGFATDSAGVPACNMFHDIWFTFRAYCNGNLSIESCGSSFDTSIGIYTGSCASPVNIQCNTAGCSVNPSRASSAAALTAGVTYIIRLGGATSATGFGSLSFTVSFDQSPPNDNCDAAQGIGTSVSVNTNCATDSTEPTGCAAFADGRIHRDLWYRWIAPINGTTSVETCSNNFDTRVSVHTGTCTSLAFIACNDNTSFTPACGSAGWSRLTFNATLGTAYLIRVGGASGAGGSTQLRITPPAPSNNDFCANATLVGEGSHFFSTLSATTEIPIPCFMENDVWFRYQATCDGPLTVFNCGSSFATVLAIYEGTCTGLTLLACSTQGSNTVQCPDFSPTSPQAGLEITGDANNFYYIRVGSLSPSIRGTGFVNIVPGAINNDCVRPRQISIGTTEFFTHCADDDGPPAPVSCAFTPNAGFSRDLWFRHNITQTGVMRIETCGAGLDTRLAVYGAGPPCPIPDNALVACNDDGCGLQSFVSFNAVSGGIILIRVGGVNPSSNGGVAQLSIRSGLPPANDDCATANQIIFSSSTNQALYRSFNSSGATNSTAPGCAAITNDVWFRVTPGCRIPHRFSTCGSQFNTAMALYTGSCGALTLVAGSCIDDAPCNPGEPTQSSAVIDYTPTSTTPLYVRIGGIAGATGPGILTITPLTGGASDNCTGTFQAQPVSFGQTLFDTRCANTDFSNNIPDTCSGNSNGRFDQDLWFRFVPTACRASLTIETCGSNFDTALAVYPDQCPNSLDDDILACNSDACGLQSRIVISRPDRYDALYIRVGGEDNGDNGSGILTITGQCPPADFNMDGTVGSQDFFDFLAAFFSGLASADFNHDGAVTSQDFFDFVAAFFG